MKIEHVQQKHGHSCMISCIAMVLGWDYDKVFDEFKNDFSKKGAFTDAGKEFVCDHGFSVIEKRGTGYIDVREHNKRMMTPFAPVHIVTVQQFIDCNKRHSFVMDAKGRHFEPSDKAIKQVLFYRVDHIMGFYKT